MKRKIFTMAAFLVALAAGLIVQTAGARAMAPGGASLYGQQLLSVQDIERVITNPRFQLELFLKDEELDLINDALTDYRKNLINSDARLRVLEIELAALMDEDSPNQKLIEEKIDSITHAHAGLRKNEIRTILQIKEMLSDSQYRLLQRLAVTPPPPGPIPPAPSPAVFK